LGSSGRQSLEIEASGWPNQRQSGTELAGAHDEVSPGQKVRGKRRGNITIVCQGGVSAE